MAQDHQLQQQRFELKYLVSGQLAARVREYVRCHLELDEYSSCQPDGAYPIHSLYLDSDDLETHRATVNGTKNRFKLRLRYYDEQPGSPVFCEVKARVDNCILKQRCGVKRAAIPFLLSGQWPEPDWMLSSGARSWMDLERFLFLARRLQARPRLHNRYLREAWVCPQGNSVRVTFDRRIQAEPWFSCQPTCGMTRPVNLLPGTVVLELKFTNRFPEWFRGLVEHFSLMQASCAKYSDSVTLIGEPHFHRDVFYEWSRRVDSRPERGPAVVGKAAREVAL